MAFCRQSLGILSVYVSVIVFIWLILGHYNPLHAQELKPFSAQAESQFRRELQQYLHKSTPKKRNKNISQKKPSRQYTDQADTGLYGDLYRQPLASYEQDQTAQENRIENSTRDAEFSDDPFRRVRNTQQLRGASRFEANGGEIRNADLDSERRAGQRRNTNNELGQARSGALSSGIGEGADRVNNQDSLEDRNAIAELEGRASGNRDVQNNTNRFDEEFLAAERSIDQAEQQDQTAININPRNNGRAGAARTLAQNNGQQGNLIRRAGRRSANNTYNQNAADDNDITGSLRNNELEDTYAQEGKRIGTFLLFPELTLTGLYSDNPTASVQNGPGDIAIEMVPRFLLRSDWARHEVELQGQFLKSNYKDLTSENLEEWLVNARARIDIQDNHYFELEGRIEETQDSRGDVDNLNTDAELANLHTMMISALYNYEWNRTTLRFGASLTDYDYEDVANGLGVVTNNDDQDFLESNLTARLGFTVHSGLYIFGEAGYVKREYDAIRDDDGFQRGSEGQLYRAGIIHDLTSKVRFEATIGYQSLFADDARYIDAEELVYEASLTYRPSLQTSVSISSSKALEGSELRGTIAVEEIEHAIELNHYFRPHILLTSRLNYELEKFQGVDVEQETLTAALTLQYIFNRHARLIAGYEFSDVSTNDGAEYQENQFRLGLNLRP